MTVLLGFLLFLAILNIGALTGWAPSTRDGRDWHADPTEPAHRRGPVHQPASWGW